MQTEEFLMKLSSSDPVPGGGGVCALVAALSASLCSMVGNLTSGKKKYAQYQQDIERLIARACIRRESLFSFIEKDATAFEPLAKAYSIPKDDPGREEVLQAALLEAATVPLGLMEEIAAMTDMIGELADKGSRLAVSDVGVAAALARSAIEGAVMNVYVNTRMMTDTEKAKEMEDKAAGLLEKTVEGCNRIYAQVLDELRPER